jgi:hypothetical protein
LRAKRLNANGIRLFESFLDDARVAPPDQNTIDALRSDPSYVEPSTAGLEVTKKTFTTKKSVAIYFCERIAEANLSRPPEDEGLWSWLTIYYSDSLLPSNTNRSIAIRENARYVCSTRFDRKYRHRIAGPTRALWNYRDEPEVLDFMLYGRPFELNDIEEQILSRQQRIQNPTIIRLANRLYFNPATGRVKTSTQNKTGTPGALRRLLRVLEQYERTYDLYSKNVDEIYEWLPDEFDRWKNGI